MSRRHWWWATAGRIRRVDLSELELLALELPQLPTGAAPEALAARHDVRAFLTREVHEQTRALASYEQVRHIIVVPTEFSVEGGELSPSMKIKRRVVEKEYATRSSKHTVVWSA